jgi:hypothetical protein
MQTIKFFHYETTGRLPFKRRWHDRKLPAVTLSVCREVLSDANRDPVVDVAGVFRRTRFNWFSLVPIYSVRKQAKTCEQSGDDPGCAPISHAICPGPATRFYVPAATRSMNRLPLPITRSPGASPSNTWTILPLVSPGLIRRSSIALLLSRTSQTRAVPPS